MAKSETIEIEGVQVLFTFSHDKASKRDVSSYSYKINDTERSGMAYVEKHKEINEIVQQQCEFLRTEIQQLKAHLGV